MVTSGNVRLEQGTFFSNNGVLTVYGCLRNGVRIANGEFHRQNMHLPGGTVFYKFPTPPGAWLPNADCRVYREPCPSGSAGNKCRAAFNACSRAPDDGSRTASVSASECVGTFSHLCTGTVECQPRTFIQPCDWEAEPALIGIKIFVLPTGIPVNEPFPYRCAAGLLGSHDEQYQLSALCQGPCPAGYTCPDSATTHPVLCVPGHFCPPGSVQPTPW